MKLTVLDPHRSVKFIHHDSSLQPHIMQQFSACRRDSRFIDLEVEVKGVVFPCHQILLDAFCPYFTAYFSFNERKIGEQSGEEGGRMKEVERVSLKYTGVTAKGFSKLLDFMYTAELEVTTEDVIDVLRSADFLQFHQVVLLCSAFVQQHITADTCLQVLALAQAHDLCDLAEKALGFVLSNITEVILHEDFPRLSKEVLVSIISNPCLELQTETTVVEAVLLWVKASERLRRPMLSELLRHARLHHIDLEQLEKNYRLTGSTEMIEQVLNGKKDITEDSLSVSPLPDRLREVLVVVNRETERKYRGIRQDWRTLYFYNPDAAHWDVLSELPFEDRESYTATVVNNVLYVTGGQCLDIGDIYCNKIVFSDNWAFHPLDDKWEERQSMMVPRFNHSAAAMLNKLYVVGGRASSSSHSLRREGEVYDPSTNQWTLIASVCCINGIGNAALTSLDGKLYILGGSYNPSQRTSTPYETYLGAQVYSPQEDIWRESVCLEREITRKNLRLSSGGVVALEGFLLLLDDDIGKAHQLYNPVSQTLTSLMQAHGHHWFAGYAIYQGQLVCTGGLEDRRLGVTDMVHAWDLTSEERGWRMLPSLPRPMSHHACVSMHLSLTRPPVSSESP